MPPDLSLSERFLVNSAVLGPTVGDGLGGGVSERGVDQVVDVRHVNPLAGAGSRARE